MGERRRSRRPELDVLICTRLKKAASCGFFYAYSYRYMLQTGSTYAAVENVRIESRR